LKYSKIQYVYSVCLPLLGLNIRAYRHVDRVLEQIFPGYQSERNALERARKEAIRASNATGKGRKRKTSRKEKEEEEEEEEEEEDEDEDEDEDEGSEGDEQVRKRKKNTDDDLYCGAERKEFTFYDRLEGKLAIVCSFFVLY
jgi:hypothetical protein